MITLSFEFIYILLTMFAENNDNVFSNDVHENDINYSNEWVYHWDKVLAVLVNGAVLDNGLDHLLVPIIGEDVQQSAGASDHVP